MTSIFVAKLDFNITSEQLKQAFQAYGTVIKATVATDRETGKSRGFGFIEMADRDEAAAAFAVADTVAAGAAFGVSWPRCRQA